MKMKIIHLGALAGKDLIIFFEEHELIDFNHQQAISILHWITVKSIAFLFEIQVGFDSKEARTVNYSYIIVTFILEFEWPSHCPKQIICLLLVLVDSFILVDFFDFKMRQMLLLHEINLLQEC
jgi:hypothetical protein